MGAKLRMMMITIKLLIITSKWYSKSLKIISREKKEAKKHIPLCKKIAIPTYMVAQLSTLITKNNSENPSSP